MKRILGKTLGVPLFKEQAMQVAIHCAGFTTGEGDQMRRSMSTFKLTGRVSRFRDKLIGGMVARGYERMFENFYVGAIRFSMSRIEARSIRVSDVCTLNS